MKNRIFMLFITFLAFGFTGCVTKSQNDILASSKKDASDLLDKVIEKEKKINQLTKKLEECKNEKAD